MSDPQGKSLVRFLTGENAVVGVGFLVSERSILTCAHVIASALRLRSYPPDAPADKVRLDFPITAPGQALTATITHWQPPQENGGGDIALIELDSEPPDGVAPAHLVAAEGLWDHTFRAFGFPQGQNQGIWASGKLRAPQASGWIMIEGVEDTGYRVQRGFSGGAVWDDQLDGVVGMVVAEDPAAALKVAYIIPTDVLVKALPTLSQQTIPPCPYRGLFAFREEDADYFFGREKFTGQLKDVLRQKPFVTISGASGSGKSSVVYAGLLPLLRREGSWRIATLRPGEHPFRSLSAALMPLLEPQMSEIDRLNEIKKLEQQLQQGILALREVIDIIIQKSSTQHLLLVADQFEELYTLNHEEEIRQRFLDILLDAARMPQSLGTLNFNLVLTLRADFLGQAVSYRPFADALQDNNLFLGPMSPQELQDAIKKPAEKNHIGIEDGLTEFMLKDVSADASHLPLLEFALTLLWAKQKAHKLTHAAYNAIGGVEKALTEHAEAIYSELTQEEQARAQEIFIQFVRPGEGTDDTRRIATRAEVGEENWGLLERLAKARLVVINNSQPNGEETVELVHEALIRNWQSLREWITSNREFRTWQERLRAAQHQWQANNQDADALLRGALLVEATRWSMQRPDAIKQTEKAFIEASQQYQVQEAQRFQKLYEQEQQLRQEAEQQREEAQRQRELAEQKSREAEEQRLLAEQALQKAEEQRRIAEQQRREAEQQRQIALARQLVAQVELLREQQSNLLQLRVLLAVEALQRFPSPEANQALRRGLILLPRSITSIQPPGTLKALALSPDGRYLTIVNKNPALELWEIMSNRQFVSLPHQSMVKTVAFSNDSNYLVAVCEDRNVWLWELNTCHQLAHFSHDEDVRTLALSPDKHYLVITSEHAVRIWDVHHDRELALLKHDDIIFSVTFNPDERCFATAGMNGTARVWETTSGRMLARLDHPRGVSAVTFSPIISAGSYLATACDDYAVRIWKWEAGISQQTAPLQHESAVNAIAFSADGKYLATAGQDRAAQVWDVASGKLITRIMHEGSVNTVVFSSDGRCLITISEDRTVGMWETRSGYRLLCLLSKDVDYKAGDKISLVTLSPDRRYLTTASENGTARISEIINSRLTHERAVNSAIFSPGGNFIATASEDRTAGVWETTNGRLFLRLSHEGNVWAVAFSNNERFLATAGEDGTARIWEIASGRQVSVLSHNRRNVNAVTFSPDGRCIATSSEDGTAGIWETLTGRQVALLQHGNIVNEVIYSPDGRFVATASLDSSARIWEAATGKELVYLPHKRAVNDVAFSPDGCSIATACYDHYARIWETGSGKQLALLPHEKYVNSVIFSRDGKYVATASKDGDVRIWEAPTGRLLISLEHKDSVSAISFSPDGRCLATACDDQVARIWEISSGRQLAYLTHGDKVNSIAFSLDGSKVLSASADSTVRLWLWRSNDLIEEAKKRLTRNLTLEEWKYYLGNESYRKTFPNLP